MNKKSETNPKFEVRKGSGVSFVIAGIASVLLLASLKLPLWHMRLEAPQYRDEEALKIAVHANAMKGDLRELKVLNQYIGVHVPPTLPQFKWLPGVIIAGAVLGLAAAFLGNRARSRAQLVIASALATALVFAAIQAQVQMHDIGHKRDQKTILAGMHNFTPPFLGTTKIAQFTVSSRLGLGAWLIGSALVLQSSAAWVSRKPVAAEVRRRTTALEKTAGTENPPPHVGGYKALTL